MKIPYCGTLMRTSKDTIEAHRSLTLYFDGKCQPKNPGGVACVGWALEGNDPDKPQLVLAEGKGVVADGGANATNNYAEWCALGFGLKALAEYILVLIDTSQVRELRIVGDSQLVVEQIQENWKCKAARLQPLKQRCLDLLLKMGLEKIAIDPLLDFDDNPSRLWTASWVPREQNQYADDLTNQAYREYLKKKH